MLSRSGAFLNKSACHVFVTFVFGVQASAFEGLVFFFGCLCFHAFSGLSGFQISSRIFHVFGASRIEVFGRGGGQGLAANVHLQVFGTWRFQLSFGEAMGVRL